MKSWESYASVSATDMTSVLGQRQRNHDDKIMPVFNLVAQFNSVAEMSRHLAKKSLQWHDHIYLYFYFACALSLSLCSCLLCSFPLLAKLEKQTQDISGWPTGTE